MSRSPTSRRQFAALFAVVVTGGCLDGGPGTPSTATESGSVEGPASGTPTATEAGGFDPRNPENTTIAVRLRNRYDRWVEMRLRITSGGTNETVHDEAYDVAPNGEPWTVYRLSGGAQQNESIRIVVTALGTGAEVTVDTPDCWGTVTGQVGTHGEVWADADHCRSR